MNTTKKRCKKGERRNKLGICEKKQQPVNSPPPAVFNLLPAPSSIAPSPLSSIKLPASVIQQSPSVKKTRRPRCKKGERRNKEGICKKKITISPTNKPPTKSSINLTPFAAISSFPTTPPLSILPQSLKLPEKQITIPEKIEKTKRIRCKKGERKNKQGICEKIKISSLKPRNPTQHNRHSTTKSYRPTVNKKLVSIKTGSELHNIKHCNKFNNNLVKLPLKIKINGKCTSIEKNEAKQYLLKELKKNKHLNMKKIILPKQYDSNCWFNTFFTCMFISDKGRQFSLFFRQLMIEGKLYNNDAIPANLINAFSLLNYFIHCCLAGDEFALAELNTNTVIHYIYENIPKNTYVRIVPTKQAGNPFWFYQQLISYLSINSVRSKIYGNLEDIVFDYTQVPHIMILVYNQDNNNQNKQSTLTFGKYKYELDSACIRDNTAQHFCCFIHCNKKEYLYDGATTHDGDINYDGVTTSRLRKMQWKHLLNKNNQFTIYYNDVKPLRFNFLIGYSMLIYYRKS